MREGKYLLKKNFLHFTKFKGQGIIIDQGRGQTFSKRVSRGQQGGLRVLTGTQMVALDRPMYKVSFHLGEGAQGGWVTYGGSSPPVPWLHPCIRCNGIHTVNVKPMTL